MRDVPHLQRRYHLTSRLYRAVPAPPETESEELRAARSAPGALLFSIVRHPIERFRSGLAELIRRGTLNAGTTTPFLLARIAARGFFDPHLWPQTSALATENRTKATCDNVCTLGSPHDAELPDASHRLLAFEDRRQAARRFYRNHRIAWARAPVPAGRRQRRYRSPIVLVSEAQFSRS